MSSQEVSFQFRVCQQRLAGNGGYIAVFRVPARSLAEAESLIRRAGGTSISKDLSQWGPYVVIGIGRRADGTPRQHLEIWSAGPGEELEQKLEKTEG